VVGRPQRRESFARARADADREVEATGIPVTGGLCGGILRDQDGRDTGRRCTSGAGRGTNHVGLGRCVRHGGNTVYENARAAQLMGHALARPLGVSPWEALIGEVRRSAGAVAWLDWKLSTATSDEDVSPGGELWWVVKERQLERMHLGKISKLALDAGVAERLLAQVQHEARGVAEVLTRVLGDERLQLSDGQRAVIRDILRTEAQALRQERPALEGESEVTSEGE